MNKEQKRQLEILENKIKSANQEENSQDRFVHEGYQRALLAVDVVKTIDRLTKAYCVYSTLAFTHAITPENPAPEVKMNDILELSKDAAKSAHQQGTYFIFEQPDQFTFPKFSQSIRECESAWIIISSDSRFAKLFHRYSSHMLGLRRNPFSPGRLQVWDSDGDKLFEKQTGYDSSFCALDEGGVYSRIRRLHTLLRDPIFIFTFRSELAGVKFTI